MRVVKTEIRNPETYGELPLRDERCAWRVMYLCHLGRELPDLPCEALFEEAEWKSVYSVVGKPFSQKGCPKLAEMVSRTGTLEVILIASKMPGAQSVWLGLQRCFDLSIAWKTFGHRFKKNFMWQRYVEQRAALIGRLSHERLC